MQIIELLEGRRLLSGSSAAQVVIDNNPAVVSARQTLADAQAKLTTDLADTKTDSAAHAAEIKSAITAARTLIAQDKAAIKAATDDATRAALKEQLSNDKDSAAAGVQAAKAEAKAHAAENKALIKSDKAAIKSASKQLKVAVKEAKSGQKTAVRALIDTGTSALADGTFSDTEIQQFAADLKAAAQGATKPSDESVQQLATDLASVLQTARFSTSDINLLATDAQAVLNSANISQASIDAIVADAQKVFSKVQLSPSQLLSIGTRLLDIYHELNPTG